MVVKRSGTATRAARKRLRGKDGKFVTNPQPLADGKPEPTSVRVLNTTELLEIILTHLTTKDLLLSQRVCRKWRALSCTSLHIRRALFLEPAECDSISYLDWRLDDRGYYTDPRCNLQLGEHIRGPKIDQPPKRYVAHWGRSRDDAGQERVFVNPLLADKFPVLSREGIYWCENNQDLSVAMQRPEASWRQMSICQPPIECLAIEWDSPDESGDWCITTFSKVPGTMGVLMEGLFQRLCMIGEPAWILGSEAWEQWTGNLTELAVR